MIKWIGILLLIVNSAVGQITYKQEFNGLYSNLDRKTFDNQYFADSIKMFIFMDSKIVYNKKETNITIVDGLNGFLEFLNYDGFKISESSSEFDKGFIITFYTRDRYYTALMVVNKENKVNVILIK